MGSNPIGFKYKSGYMLMVDTLSSKELVSVRIRLAANLNKLLKNIFKIDNLRNKEFLYIRKHVSLKLKFIVYNVIYFCI